MIHLEYKLSEEEAIQYYEMIGSNAKETKTARTFAMIWFPALVAAITIALKKGGNVVWIIGAVFLSLIWVFFLAPRMFRDVTRTAAKRKLEDNSITRNKIDVHDNNGVFTIDNTEKTPTAYYVYFDLFIIAFSDGTNLIVPTRAFKNDEAKMEQFLKDVVVATEKNKDEKTA